MIKGLAILPEKHIIQGGILYSRAWSSERNELRSEIAADLGSRQNVLDGRFY
jgi:hypothetical protein